MYYHEVTGDVQKRFGHIAPREELKFYKGFRSLYCFDESARDYFQQIGKIKGLKQFPVGGDELFIDIDNDEQLFKDTLEKIKKAGYKFEAWESGGKGYHIILFHEFIFDKNLPFWQREWVKDRKITSDLCIYEHGRLIRLPHTLHQKTGKPKKLLENSEGRFISLPIDRTPPKQELKAGRTQGEGDVGLLGIMLQKFDFDPIYNGSRNNRIYALLRCYKEVGFSESSCEEFASLLNERLEEPLDESELSLILKGILV